MAGWTIDDRLESAASCGEMEIDLFLWRKTISQLRANGLKVTEKFPSKRKGQVYCNIIWANANPSETTGSVTQANHLYGIAQKAKES